MRVRLVRANKGQRSDRIRDCGWVGSRIGSGEWEMGGWRASFAFLPSFCVSPFVLRFSLAFAVSRLLLLFLACFCCFSLAILLIRSCGCRLPGDAVHLGVLSQVEGIPSRAQDFGQVNTICELRTLRVVALDAHNNIVTTLRSVRGRGFRVSGRGQGGRGGRVEGCEKAGGRRRWAGLRAVGRLGVQGGGLG